MRTLFWSLLIATLTFMGGHAVCSQSNQAPETQENRVNLQAKGTFEVKVTPAPSEEKTQGAAIGRMYLDKQFHGDLEATSTGQMLAVYGNVKGSGAYVAIEVVSGTLNGKKGSFALQHSGTMTAGNPQMSVIVVPDSGTDELTGIAGSMTIKIEGGKHFYEFDYTLPHAAR
jgi:hypothetical protein